MVRDGCRHLRGAETAGSAAVFAGVGAAADVTHIVLAIEGGGKTRQRVGVRVDVQHRTCAKLEAQGAIFNDEVGSLGARTPLQIDSGGRSVAGCQAVGTLARGYVFDGDVIHIGIAVVVS